MSESERALRTLFQVIVSATFTQAVNALVVDLDPRAQIIATVLLAYLVSYAQNWLEERGYIQPMLKGEDGRES